MLKVTVLKSATLWGLTHGVSRVFLPLEVRRGNPLARGMVEPALRADPTPVWEAIRAAGPLSGGAKVSATASYAVSREVLRSDAFGVAAGTEMYPRPVQRVLDRCLDPWALGPIDPPSLLALDPPDHTRLRRLVSRAFTARQVAAMEGRITALTVRLLDELEAGPARAGEFDLVAEFASRLPVAVIGDLLGVPEAEQPQLQRWGDEASLRLDAGLTWRQYHASDTALREMHRWFDGHIARLRTHPGDDLLSRILQGADQLPEAERPTDVELRAVGLLVLGAGFETTVNLIGNAVALLSEHPDQRDLVVAEPSRWANAVEEVLRFDSPVQFNARRTLRSTRLAGRDLGAGHVVVILVGGANRDPEVFTDPNRFDVTRPDAGDHLAFSAGAHFCLGAGLARLETVVGLRELYARFPDLRTTSPGVRRETRVLRGYSSLPATTLPATGPVTGPVTGGPS